MAARISGPVDKQEIPVVDKKGVVDEVVTFFFEPPCRYGGHTPEGAHLGPYSVRVIDIKEPGQVEDTTTKAASFAAGVVLKATLLHWEAGLEGKVTKEEKEQEEGKWDSNLLRVRLHITGGKKHHWWNNDTTTRLELKIIVLRQQAAALPAAPSALAPSSPSLSPAAPQSSAPVSPAGLEEDSRCVFGPKEWERYFGIEVDPIPIPEEIIEKMKREPDHMLVFLPGECKKKGSGRQEPFTFAMLQELFQQGTRTPFFSSSSRGETELMPSHWVLLTKRFLTGTTNQATKEQQEIVNNRYQEYRLPTLMEGVASVLLHGLHTGKVEYSSGMADPALWFLCKGKEQMYYVGGYREAPKGDAQPGLRIKERLDRSIAPNVGVAGVFDHPKGS